MPQNPRGSERTPHDVDATEDESAEEAKIIAVDSKPVIRKWETASGEEKAFRGLLGLTVSVFKEANFKKKYESILDEVFDAHSIPRGNRVYKGADVYRLFDTRPKIADSFIFKVSRKILQLENIRVNLFCTTINIGQQLASVMAEEGRDIRQEDLDQAHTKRIMPMYGESSGKRMVTVSEFLQKIEPVYPGICAWKLCQVTKIRNQHFLSDYFEGDHFKAWDDLISENHVELVPKGDQCSAYISATDIVLRCIDSILERKHLYINKDNLNQVLTTIAGKVGSETIHVHHIGNQDIDSIKPSMPRPIRSELFIKHPIIFVFNEKTGLPEQKAHRSEIENSPLMDSLYTLAYSLDGGLTFYDPRISTSQMRDNDYFVTYGDNGKKKVKELKTLGYNLIHNDMSEEYSKKER